MDPFVSSSIPQMRSQQLPEAGRLVRFGVLSVLTVFFGPQIVGQVKNLFKNHLWLAIVAVVVVAGLVYLLFRLLRQPVKEVAEEMKHSEGTRN